MKIAIIGTGNVGGTLATAWAAAGHQIFLGVRDPNNFKGQDLRADQRTTVHSIKEASEQAAVITVATPPEVAIGLSQTFPDLSNKVLIDTTNAIRTKPTGYPTAFHAFSDLTAAKVVKCFNSTGFENMQNPRYGTTALDMFMAGDAPDAKAVAQQLAMDLGFANCYDFGGADRVELLEQLAFAWINLAIFQGAGRGIGFKVHRR